MSYFLTCHFTTIVKFKHSAQWHFQIVLYLLAYSFYQKMSRYNVFQYEIPDRMSYLRALFNNFEHFFEKYNFSGKEFAGFHSIFNLKTVFALQMI